MKDNTLREILDTGTIIINITSSGTGLSMTGQTNFTTHFGDDWGVTYKGKKTSLQEFIEALLAEEVRKARLDELKNLYIYFRETEEEGVFEGYATEEEIIDRIKQLEKGE